MKCIIKQAKNFLIYLSVFTFMFVVGCKPASDITPISRTDFFFDTVITITLYDETQVSLLDDCIQMCGDYEALFSRTVSGSDISKLNRAGTEPVPLSSDTIDVINKALYYNKLSNGAFDITIGSVSTLWDFSGNNTSLDGSNTAPPSDILITEQLRHVNSANILINGQTIALADAETMVDLGGIAKGYIADRLKEYLVKNGVKHAIIDLGGNILTIGNRPDGTPYHIGIKKPFDPTGSVITSISVTDKSVITSGTYERYFIYEDELYHHVLSPCTGYPTDNELSSVTILSDNSVTGDALSTACLVLGRTEGMELIESLPDVEALFITTEKELIRSSGFPGN